MDYLHAMLSTENKLENPLRLVRPFLAGNGK